MSKTGDSSSNVAVCPGSFDPLTNGHIDIIERACAIFDHVVVAVLVNLDKTPLFTIDERVAILRDVFRDRPGVEIDTFHGLLVEYARRKGARAIIRGLRAISDFEYEFQMALMNRRLDHDLETVFLMPAEQYTYTSSRLIKEVFRLGGAIDGLVPSIVLERLRQKQASLRAGAPQERKA